MYIGACYYPEHWPQERWTTDLELMKEIGFNVIRMGDYVWSQCEPQPGEYRFDWLVDVVNRFGAEGVKTVMCTPTSGIPAWVYRECPEVVQVDRAGNRREYGGRDTFCYNNPYYHDRITSFITAFVSAFVGNPHIILWQVDNELGGGRFRCYCESCKSAYRDYAKEKFGTVEKYNESLGLVFWSNEIQSWDELFTPKTTTGRNPGLLLEYDTFCSESVINYCLHQTKIINEQCPGVPVTTNYMGAIRTFDHYKNTKALDVASFDAYPVPSNDVNTSMMLDFTRSLKKQKFWMLEQQCSPTAFRPVNPALRPDQSRLYTYLSMAKGAQGITYFRWRSARFGAEQLGAGLLRHDGERNRTFAEIKELTAELERIGEVVDGSEPTKAEVGIVFSYESIWAMQCDKQLNSKMTCDRVANSFYRTCHAANVPVDFVFPGEELSQYKLIVVPLMAVMSDADASWLKDYVSNGGTVLVTAFSGVYNEFHTVSDNTYTGPLRDMLGVMAQEYDALHDDTPARIVCEGVEYPAELLAMVCQNEGSDVLAEIGGMFYAGSPALTRNAYGTGNAYYLATYSNQEFYSRLLSKFVDELAIDIPPIQSDGAHICTRKSGSHTYYIAINFDETAKTLELEREFTEMISGNQAKGSIELPGTDVLVLKA